MGGAGASAGADAGGSDSSCLLAWEFYTKEKGTLKFSVSKKDKAAGGKTGTIPYLVPRKYQTQKVDIAGGGHRAVRKQYLFVPGTYIFK